MDFFDGLGNILPFLIFLAITILGNLGDKKKPKVKIKTKPLPRMERLPDIKPPTPAQSKDKTKSPMEEMLDILAPVVLEPEPEAGTGSRPDQAGQESASGQHRPHHPEEYEQVHSYQQYLEKRDRAKSKDKVPQEANAEEQATKRLQPGLPVAGFSLSQAILSAEILGKPKALQRRRR